MRSSLRSVNLAIGRKRKQGVSKAMTNQSRVENEVSSRQVNFIDEGGDNIDRISELPESLIHQILSHVRSPKDAARTSVLSKRWKNIWTSYLTFNFDEKSFQARGQEGKENFINFVENTISTRLNLVSSIQKFRLCMTSFDSKLAPNMNGWISAATEKNVKDLEIHVEALKKRQYSLPQAIFTTKTLTSLKLFGCSLDPFSDIKLPHLRELSIKKIHINVHKIQSFIGGCPSLEDLRLVQCSGLECLHISTPSKLNRIEVHECHGLKLVELVLPNLDTFWYHQHKYSTPCKINLDACENLKSLTLKDEKITQESFQDLISKFNLLERLVVMECHTLGRMIISGQKLKRLVLIRCKNLNDADIDAPNLSSFEYTGIHMPFTSMNTSSLHEAKISFESIWKNHSKDLAVIWSDMLQKFLERFDQSKGFKLVEHLEKDVIVHEELSQSWFPLSNNLKLDIIKQSSTLEAFTDSLLRTCHPDTISIVSSSNSSEFQKLMYEKIWNREKEPSCCRYYIRKCWRHYVYNVEVYVSEGAISKRSSMWNPWLRSDPTIQQMTAFKFNWRSDGKRRKKISGRKRT